MRLSDDSTEQLVADCSEALLEGAYYMNSFYSLLANVAEKSSKTVRF